jgi:aspartate/methionine/tyrosine aminotransferase
MIIRKFLLERFQSLYENNVEFNLGDSGAHPVCIEEILSKEEIAELCHFPLSYGDTKGSLRLREAIAKQYPGANVDNIVVTHGTAEANFLSAFTLLEPGDEIIYVVPNYLQLLGLAEIFGVTVHQVYLDQAWQIPLKKVEQLLNSKTRLIAFCNPNNPTASRVNQETLNELSELANSVGAYLLIDEIYREGSLFSEIRSSHYGVYGKTIVNSSLSKALGMPGLRLGWTIGPKNYIEQLCLRRDYVTIAPNIVSDFIATRLFENPLKYEEILLKNRREVQESFAIFENWAKDFDGILEWTRPEAGAMVYVRYHLPISSRDLMQKILKEQNVLIVAGEDYGIENYIRIGVGTRKDDLKIALERVGEVLNTIIKGSKQ